MEALCSSRIRYLYTFDDPQGARMEIRLSGFPEAGGQRPYRLCFHIAYHQRIRLSGGHAEYVYRQVPAFEYRGARDPAGGVEHGNFVARREFLGYAVGQKDQDSTNFQRVFAVDAEVPRLGHLSDTFLSGKFCGRRHKPVGVAQRIGGGALQPVSFSGRESPQRIDAKSGDEEIAPQVFHYFDPL